MSTCPKKGWQDTRFFVIQQIVGKFSPKKVRPLLEKLSTDPDQKIRDDVKEVLKEWQKVPEGF